MANSINRQRLSTAAGLPVRSLAKEGPYVFSGECARPRAQQHTAWGGVRLLRTWRGVRILLRPGTGALPPLNRYAGPPASNALQLLFGCVAAILLVVPAFAAQDDDVQPDVNALRAKADAGSVTAQSQLADHFIASDDYTNAVIWYRKAAEQGDLPAQLSLASLLLAGRGAEKNPQEAAKWLRAAADRIENRPVPAPTNVVAKTTNTPPAIPTNAIIITRTPPPPVTNSPPANAAPPISTNSPPSERIQRAGAIPREPTLQDVPPVLLAPQTPR